MDTSIKEQALERYIEKLHEKLLFVFFNKQEFITGQGIKSFTKSEQVNTFILHQLFAQWHQQMDNLKSPYFDYENTDVNNAMKELMNTLSFNIKISKENLDPLLKYALDEVFDFILHPLNYLSQRCFSFEELLINRQKILSETKFIKTNRVIFESVLLAKNDDEIFAKEDFLEACQNSYLKEKEYLTSFSDIIILFSDLMPTDIIAIFDNTSQSSLVNTELEDEKKSLNDRFAKHQVTVADRLASETKRNNLINAVSVNERFAFINHLFDGDVSVYQTALRSLSTMKTSDSAKDFLEKNYANHYDWEEHPEIRDNLFVLIEQNF